LSTPEDLPLSKKLLKDRRQFDITLCCAEQPKPGEVALYWATHAVAYLAISRAEAIANSAAARIPGFLGISDAERIAAMTAAVDAELHRERGGDREIDAA
tara:strand:+ start:606 stop:905 length:300 start_codon:yes stop_codon:yes gene_type:complete